MFVFKLLFVLVICLSSSYCKLDKYCSVCEDHTMCIYHGIGVDCENPGGFGVTKNEQKEILDVHNWLRRLVASGHETRGIGGPQPKAANLMKIIWDNELSKVAQRWADQCQFQHDTCRDDPRWKVGQNIYWKWEYPKHQINWTEAILSWYNEVSLYDPHEVESFRFESTTGHYTQLLWHDTFAIGCGRRDYGANKLYVCNYGPAGNWLGEPLYAIGEPCSKCPRNTVCDEFLCAYQNTPTEIKVPPKPEKPEKLEINLLSVLTDKKVSEARYINETRNLEILKPPNKNAKDVYGSGDKITSSEIKNQTEQNEKKVESSQKTVIAVQLNKSIEHKATANSVDENRIEIDEDTKNYVDDIKLRIDELVKKIMGKLRN